MGAMSFRRSVAIAVAVVVIIVVGTAILNRGVSHTPYIAALWTMLAVIALAVYWGGRRFLSFRRTK